MELRFARIMMILPVSLAVVSVLVSLCAVVALVLPASAWAQETPGAPPPIPPEFIEPGTGNIDTGGLEERADSFEVPPNIGLPQNPEQPADDVVSGDNPPTVSGDNPSGAPLTNPLQFNSLEEFLRAILDAVILIAFPILILFLVYAGFLFVKARGNEAELERAKRVFLWTLVGALLVLGAQALSIAIEGTVEEIQGRIETPRDSLV